MREWPREVSVRSTLVGRGAGYPNVGGCTRPEWRPDFRVLEDCSDDQITRVCS